jgi:hypothetical protein
VCRVCVCASKCSCMCVCERALCVRVCVCVRCMCDERWTSSEQQEMRKNVPWAGRKSGSKNGELRIESTIAFVFVYQRTTTTKTVGRGRSTSSQTVQQTHTMRDTHVVYVCVWVCAFVCAVITVYFIFVISIDETDFSQSPG